MYERDNVLTSTKAVTWACTRRWDELVLRTRPTARCVHSNQATAINSSTLARQMWRNHSNWYLSDWERGGPYQNGLQSAKICPFDTEDELCIAIGWNLEKKTWLLSKRRPTSIGVARGCTGYIRTLPGRRKKLGAKFTAERWYYSATHWHYRRCDQFLFFSCFRAKSIVLSLNKRQLTNLLTL